MNRRQKIIVSVTGIFLVLLLLVGLTYAYFLTRITGNTNDKSISVSTANLALVYGDGNGILEVAEALEPGDKVKFRTANNDIVDKKEFSVTNEGNSTTDYLVVIDNTSVVYAETIEVKGETQTAGQPARFESNDFVYTLTCTSGCNGVQEPTIFPIEGGILVGNRIKEDEVQTYELRMEYKETGLNQTNDMNKKFTARINIRDIASLNPYKENKESLAYNIINNSLLKKNGTELKDTPITKVAEEVSMGIQRYVIANDKIATYGSNSISYAEQTFLVNSLENSDLMEDCKNSEYQAANKELCSDLKVGFSTCEEVKGRYIFNPDDGYDWYVEDCTDDGISLHSGMAGLAPDLLEGFGLKEQWSYNTDESVLSVTEDHYGTSYYYRGYIKDNFVNFAGMCWRIVRIDGLGNTKLILEDQYAECNDTKNNDKNNDGKVYTGAWDIPASNGETITMNGTNPYSAGTFGYDINYITTKENYLNPTQTPEKSMINAFKYFQKNNLNGYTSKLAPGNWCYNNVAYSDKTGTNKILDRQSYYESRTQLFYDSFVRLEGRVVKNPTLECDGTVINKYNDNTDMLVGTLTADEMMFAGGARFDFNRSYYLYNSYQHDNELEAWSLSPHDFYNGVADSVYTLDNDGYVGFQTINNDEAFRPAVLLKNDIEIASGDGTKNNPYTISNN